MNRPQAMLSATPIIVEAPGQAPFLVLRLQIQCAVCGEHRIVFAGHHLRTLARIFGDTIRDFPELVEDEAQAPFEPENN